MGFICRTDAEPQSYAQATVAGADLWAKRIRLWHGGSEENSQRAASSLKEEGRNYTQGT